LNLQNLRVFLKVAELEHVTRAAEELGLSQPAVTKTIQMLESETGLELLERQGRRIALTHAGRVMQSHARQIFALEHELEEALHALRDVDGGEVTLAANTTTGVYLLPPIVARFRLRYPQVLLHIAILNSREIVEEMLNWKLDLGLVESEPANLPSGLSVEMFAYDELMLVVLPTHHWNTLPVLHPHMLAKREILLREQGSGIRKVIEGVMGVNEVLKPRLVVNQCQPNTKLAKEVLEVLPHFGIELMKTQLGQRTVYRQSAVFGQTVHNFGKDAIQAITEIDALTDEVLDLVNMPSHRSDNNHTV